MTVTEIYYDKHWIKSRGNTTTEDSDLFPSCVLTQLSLTRPSHAQEDDSFHTHPPEAQKVCPLTHVPLMARKTPRLSHTGLRRTPFLSHTCLRRTPLLSHTCPPPARKAPSPSHTRPPPAQEDVSSPTRHKQVITGIKHTRAKPTLTYKGPAWKLSE